MSAISNTAAIPADDPRPVLAHVCKVSKLCAGESAAQSSPVVKASQSYSALNASTGSIAAARRAGR